MGKAARKAGREARKQDRIGMLEARRVACQCLHCGRPVPIRLIVWCKACSTAARLAGHRPT